MVAQLGRTKIGRVARSQKRCLAMASIASAKAKDIPMVIPGGKG